MSINIDLKNIDWKGLWGKLAALRNYMNLVVPLLLVLVAALLFVPTALLSRWLREKIKTESLSRASTLDRMLEVPLSRDQYLEERKYQQAYAEDANRIERMARQTSQRELLSYRIFPSPTDTSVFIFEEFGKRFRAGIDQGIQDLKGHDAPAESELLSHIQAIQGQGATADSAYAYGLGGGGGRVSLGGGGRREIGGRQAAPGVVDESSRVIAQIVNAVCLERAKGAGVYVNPASVAGYSFWTDYSYVDSNESVTDCWYWQLGYWAIEDVLGTIGQCNAGAAHVLEAPVKRLIRVGFSRPMMAGGGGRYGGVAGADGTQTEPRPQYVLPSQGRLAAPCTGRVSAGEVNVLHFNVAFVVRAGAVMDVMRALCSSKEHRFLGADGQQAPQTFSHNQITVLESTVRAVDAASASQGDLMGGQYQYGYVGGLGMGMDPSIGVSHQLYRYGPDAVVELDLVCEYLFDRPGYESLLPDAVKKVLDSAAAQATPVM